MDVKQLESIAAQELRKHGLHGWTFGLADTRRRLGVCKYRTKRIEIAEYHARNNPPETVLDTLRHEIAPALPGDARPRPAARPVPAPDGVPAAGPGPAWKAVAIRLGATPRACDNSPETVVTP